MQHTTVADWRKSKQKQRRLKAVIEDPIFQEAVTTIFATVTPNVSGTTTIESLAIKHARLAGIHTAFDYLRALTRKEQKQEREQSDFEHLFKGAAEQEPEPEPLNPEAE